MVGSAFRVLRLHSPRFWASSGSMSFSRMSCCNTSLHLRFGLPLDLFPGTFRSCTALPIYSGGLLLTCPYHLNLLSWSFSDMSRTPRLPRMWVFLILSSLVTPHIHLSIFISVVWMARTCLLVTFQVSDPYDGLIHQPFHFHWHISIACDTRDLFPVSPGGWYSVLNIVTYVSCFVD